MMRSLLILAPGCLIFMAPPAEGGEVRIWPTAMAQYGDVRLGDVAELSGFDAATVERLSRLALRPSPEAGRAERVSLDDVRAALDGARVNLADVQLLGASQCEVTSAATTQRKSTPSAAKRPVAPPRAVAQRH